MKRKVLYIVSLLIITCTFTACDLLSGDCQVCHFKTYDQASGETTYSDEAEYCGQDLVNMKATQPNTQGGVTTSVECY
jgi:hypothetical protein